MSKRGPSDIKRNTPEEFWQSVNIKASSECWEWMGRGGKLNKGYGQLTYCKTKWLAHRLAYYLTYGDIPKGMQVCHTCDNPICCNPDHLWLGTNYDNSRDREEKGRGVRSYGPDNGQHKLTIAQIQKIREEYVPGLVGYKTLAKKYGVHSQTIKDIITRRNWKWMT